MEEQAEVKLLGRWFSVFSVRVEWALKLKGIKYVKIEEDTTNKSSLLLNSNPIYKRIPVLFHNENASRHHLLLLNTLMILGSTIHQYCLRILLRELWHVSGLSSLMRRYIYIYHIISSDGDHLSSPVSF